MEAKLIDLSNLRMTIYHNGLQWVKVRVVVHCSKQSYPSNLVSDAVIRRAVSPDGMTIPPTDRSGLVLGVRVRLQVRLRDRVRVRVELGLVLGVRVRGQGYFISCGPLRSVEVNNHTRRPETQATTITYSANAIRNFFNDKNTTFQLCTQPLKITRKTHRETKTLWNREIQPLMMYAI